MYVSRKAQRLGCLQCGTSPCLRPHTPIYLFIFCLIEIEEVFGGILEKEQDVSAGIAAIRTLLTVLEHDTCKCCVLLHNLKSVECIFF